MRRNERWDICLPVIFAALIVFAAVISVLLPKLGKGIVLTSIEFKGMASLSAEFFRITRHPIRFRLFLLAKLPSAYFSGVRVLQASEDSCSVSVPYKWFSQNPFRSTYFACLAMAAEMSTGLLSMAHVYKRKPAVSMLVTALEAKYFKKATGITVFTCEEGPAIRAAIELAVATGNGQTIKTTSVGKNAQGEIVAEFVITWSYKPKII